MRNIRSYLGNRRGQAMLEFALVLPVLILVLMGMLEFGRVMHEYMLVTEAARIGARAAVVNANDATVRSQIMSAVPAIESANITIVRGANSGDPVKVTVKGRVTIITPIIGAILPNPFTITESAVMRQ